MVYGQGYGGRLSISQVNTFKQCSFKYETVYKTGFEAADEPELTHATAGIVVHELVDKNYGKNISDKDVISAITPYMPSGVNAKQLVSFGRLQADAIEAVQKEGARWGRTYTAPTWTSFYKKNYPHLVKLAEELDTISPQQPLQLKVTEWYGLIRTALSNYPKVMELIKALNPKKTYREGLLTFWLGTTELAGRFDLIVQVEPGHSILIDWKTGVNPWNSDRIAEYDQLFLYADGLNDRKTTSKYGTRKNPVKKVAIADLTTGNLVFYEGDLKKQIKLAKKRFGVNVEAVNLYNKTGVGTVAAGNGQGCCPCQVHYKMEGGCPYVSR